MVFGVVAAVAQHAATDTRLALVSVIDKDGAAVIGLEPADLIVEEGTASGQVLAVTPALYPVAVILDTSSFARDDFQPLRDAARHFIGTLSARDVVLYTSGTPATLLVDFTKDLGTVQGAVDHTFAQPTGTPHRFDAMIDAAHHLREREARVTRMVVLSAGGPDSSARTPKDVLDAILASRSIVDVIDLRQTRAAGSSNAAGTLNPRALTPRLRSDTDADVLLALSTRTLGRYERIVAASGYGPMLDKVRTQLLSEVLVEYVVPRDAHGLKVGVRLPGVVVRGVGLDEHSPPR